MTGIICIDKPAGMTSFGVVNKVRGIMKLKKAGHTGTLDPLATGVLPVMLGSATRFLNFLPDSDKAYRAEFILGKTTDTLDITGKVTGEYEVSASGEDVEALLPEFTGKIMQLPPMFSAKSVNGVRLYELARQGGEIERTPCEVEIKRLELVGEKNGVYTLDVECSKGTYIRSLIDDIGKRLGCGAVMTSLCRTKAMGFAIDCCVTLEELQTMKDRGERFENAVIPLERLFESFEKTYVSPAQAVRFSNGGALDIERLKNTPVVKTPVCVYSPDGEFLGLGESDGTELKALKLMPR
ncbi:MAG: tRNA pseudouridine(55) synthase TruB [Eubacterium sp.]|nr:tRNA pseudouridine(55) synthase TruB [Eubacterium sp.]